MTTPLIIGALLSDIEGRCPHVAPCNDGEDDEGGVFRTGGGDNGKIVSGLLVEGCGGDVDGMTGLPGKVAAIEGGGDIGLAEVGLGGEGNGDGDGDGDDVAVAASTEKEVDDVEERTEVEGGDGDGEGEGDEVPAGTGEEPDGAPADALCAVDVGAAVAVVVVGCSVLEAALDIGGDKGEAEGAGSSLLRRAGIGLAIWRAELDL